MRKTVIGPHIGQDIDEFQESDRVSGLPHSRGIVVHTPTHKRVFVSGTGPLDDDGAIIAPGNVKQQARSVLEEIQRILENVDGSLRDLVRLDVYVGDITDDEYLDLVEVRENVLPDDQLPASTLHHHEDVGVEGMVVEMDADAFIPDDGWDVESIE